MRLSLRFVVPLLLALGAFAYVAVPLADSLMLRWFVRDLDIRSNLIASTVQEPLSGLILTGSTPRIASYFNRMLLDERLYAVGLCVDGEAAPIATNQFPPEIRCASLDTYASEAGTPAALVARHAAHRGPLRRQRRHAGCAPRPGPRHELRRAPQRGNAALPLLLLHRARRVASRSSRWSSRSSRGAAGCTACKALLARRGHPAAGPVVHRAGAAADRPRPPRSDPRSRAPVSAARRQPAHLGPGGAAGDLAERAARQRRDRRRPTASRTSTCARRTAFASSSRPAASSPRSSP